MHLQLEINMSIATEENIKVVMTACGCSHGRAKMALEKCRNNVEYAANWVMDNGAVPTPPDVSERLLCSEAEDSEKLCTKQEKLSVREPLLPEEMLWRQFDRATRQQTSMCFYVLNVNAWDLQDLDFFISYDALEEILPFLHIHRQWTWQHAYCPPESEPSLRSIMKNIGSSRGGYKTDLSVECFDKCDDLVGQEPKFIFFEMVIVGSWVHDVAMVAHSWNIEGDLWNKGSSDTRFSDRIGRTGTYCLAHCQRHHKQYLFRYEGHCLKLFSKPIKLPDEWPHHFGSSLYRDGEASVRFMSIPDDFMRPLHDETTCFDHLEK